MKARQYINMVGMAAAVLLSSCVKDTLYDTPHPDYGEDCGDSRLVGTR